MADEAFQRRLTTILAADVAGYSRLVARDEEAALRTLKSHRDILMDLIARHRGRVFGTAGDSVIAEFGSAVEAVRCAMTAQERLAEENANLPPDHQMHLRIGINVGDVMVDGDDLLGDAVNIAARLESLAEPGGITISGSTFDQVRNRLSVGFQDLGPQKVKNIPEPVRTFRLIEAAAQSRPTPRPARRTALILAGLVLVAGLALALFPPWATRSEPASISRMKLSLPDRPSVAVLPFVNLSETDDQDYFADGITEDIITDISKVSGIFVVAGSSSFSFRGKDVKISDVAEEFGVRHVLQGSVRRSGGNVRITAQLTDALRGNTIWGERYDRDISDVFAVQLDVTRQVVRAMAVTLKASEHDRLLQKYTTNIDAYDAFLRARRLVQSPGRENVEEGERLFSEAIALDPQFAGGYAGLAFNYSVKARLRFGLSPKEDARKSLEFAEKAIEIDPEFAWSYIALAGAQLSNGNHDAAVHAARRALQIQPNGYEENLFMGFQLYFAGEAAEAVRHLELARRISPHDTIRGVAFLANAYFMNGDYAKSEELRLQRITGFAVRNPNAYVWLAATQHQLGKQDEAAATVAQLLELWPDFRLSEWGLVKAFKLAENRERLYNAAAAAGVPE